MRTLIIVPTYEEAPNLPDVLGRIRQSMPDTDILVVDDSSPDGSADLAKQLGVELGNIDVLVRPEKDGLGNAYRQAFGVAIEQGYEAIVQMDADLSHDPAALPGLVAALTDGVGLVIGSRYVPGGHIPHWPWYRRGLSRYGNLYTRLALGLKVRDLTSGYRVWRCTTLQAIDFKQTTSVGYLFQIELAYRVAQVGDGIVERPITFTDRVRGYSKMSIGVIHEELTNVTWWGIRDRWRKLRHR
jgi:dolichol-phosphate mannosyltransferase